MYGEQNFQEGTTVSIGIYGDLHHMIQRCKIPGVQFPKMQSNTEGRQNPHQQIDHPAFHIDFG